MSLSLIVSSPLKAQQTAPPNRGWLFTYAVTGSLSANREDTSGFVFDVAIWRGTVRIAVRSGPMRALTGDRGAMLLRTGDSALIVLNPARQEALLTRAGELNSVLGGAMGSMQITVTDAASSTMATGAGPRVAGFATRRVDLAQRYTMQAAAGTLRRMARTEQVLQLDVSRVVARLDPGFRLFSEQFARSLGAPAPVRQALRALERGIAADFVMQSHLTSITVSANDTLRAESRSAVSEFRSDIVDPTTFVVPPGYRITEMSRLLQPRPRPATVPPP